MSRVSRTTTGLFVALCAAVLCLQATAVASVPSGKLSSAEYRQLSAGMAALNRSVGARSVNWARARSACRTVGASTALLRTQRASCLSSVAALGSLAGFPSQQRRCSRASKGATTATTTTGASTPTTTNPADMAMIQLLVCMSPRYTQLARDSGALDRSAIAARKSALARGLSGACLAALTATPADLGKAKLFASSSERLASDVKLLIKVTDGNAPSSDFNQAKIDNDVRQFENSASAVLDERGQPKLSVCPHQ